ncbi:unnamed protein product [Onchocerca ochengi]|uniref:Cullin domain-containing protein n=1 Tax=Onchocerca ochengi TaxID=42157 RepID=A0A182EV79_ONCOC|nr:unnamed protein product [Onchocerca ochengi]
MRIRFYVLENDEYSMYEGLKRVLFGMKTIVKRELKEAYMKTIREKYDKVGKDNVFMREELRDIVDELECVMKLLYSVKRMIRGIVGRTSSTYSQTFNEYDVLLA